MTNIKPVIEAVQKAAYGHGAKSIAARLGHSVQYLSRICNPEPDPDERRLLSLEAFAAILEETGDTMPLAVLAEMFGFRLVAVDAHPDHSDVRDECLDDAQKLADFHKLARDPDVPPQALRKVAQLVHDDVEETCEAHRRWWEERKG